MVTMIVCDQCGEAIAPYMDREGEITAEALAERTRKLLSRKLCVPCVHAAFTSGVRVIRARKGTK